MLDKSVYKALDGLKEGVYVVDTNLNIKFLNDYGAEIQNIKKEEVEGRNIFDVLPSLNEKNSCVYKVLKYNEPILNCNQVYKTYNGEELTVVTSCYPILKENKIVEILKIFRKLKNEDKKTEKAELPEEIQVINKKFITRMKSEAKYSFIDIIGRSAKILEIKEKCFKAAQTSSPILIYGETGTGKELFVQAIHNNSNRNNKPFIAQNCAAIPKTLFESILFGTVKGSFTGAESREGLFEMANGGTLYLDELNSMPMELQAKLLRTLQEGTVRKVGDNSIKKVDVRVIASVNEKPEEILRKGNLRSDLFFRLNVVSINLPPLRERKEDIPHLIRFFIDKFNRKFNANIEGIDKEALNKLIEANWFGNIRELEHSIEGAFNVRQDGILKIEDFNIKTDEYIKKTAIIPLKNKMADMEKTYIKEALIICEKNISKAAKYLNIPRQTLQYKIKKFDLDV